MGALPRLFLLYKYSLQESSVFADITRHSLADTLIDINSTIYGVLLARCVRPA